MKALFTSFPAGDYVASRGFYEELVGLRVQRCCSVTDPFGNIFSMIDARQHGDI